VLFFFLFFFFFLQKILFYFFFFFFSSRRRHTRCYRDWSSDVCSSDLSPFQSPFLLFHPRINHLIPSFNTSRSSTNPSILSMSNNNFNSSLLFTTFSSCHYL